MKNYYSHSLSGERLKQCYSIAPPRIIQYLDAEICHLEKILKNSDQILELGCGYGRVLNKLIGKVKRITGIDISAENILSAKEYLPASDYLELYQMNAAKLNFSDHEFDVVFCIQNGISVFGVDHKHLLDEAIRITSPGGRVIFSSYSDKFWEERLNWFEIQSEYGLIGDIDKNLIGNGIIVCKDGFRATAVGKEEFKFLLQDFNFPVKISEIDNSSIFCEIMIE